MIVLKKGGGSMYLKRKIDEYLLEWKKNEERLPLIIKGARQIGKTESINHFAEQNYSNIVSINFVLEPKYKTILSDGYAVEDIIKNISMIDTSKRFIAGDTVIIFDELQEFPDIATALKSFRIRWILKNFCGRKDTQRSTLKIS